MTVYKHSGALGPSLVLAPILALVAVAALSAAYAYVDVYSPIGGYISLLFIAGFGFGLLFSVSVILKLTKCRSSMFAAALGLGTGLLALYVSWAVFIYALLSRHEPLFDQSIVEILTSPALVWRVVESINETGWYSLGDMTPSGGVLWAFWGIEALVIVGASVMGGIIALSDEVFCERCNRWCDESPNMPRLALPSADEEPAVRQASLAALKQLAAATPGEPHLGVALKACGQCETMATAQVKLISYTVDKEGDVEENAENISEVHQISADEYQQFATLSGRPAATDEPAEAEILDAV